MGSPLLAAAKPGTPCLCNDCGHRWPQDPCFEVACPECGAVAGTYCHRPSGHAGPFVAFHRARDLHALAQGFYDHACTVPKGLSTAPSAPSAPVQGNLFAHV